MDSHGQILTIAETLIKERGFHGFSYQDIAERVGIRKASIHYHFPTKTGLGVAVLRRYRAMMRAAADQVAASPGAFDGWQALKLFLTPIRAFGQSVPDACLCGTLCGEYLSLPDAMRAEIAGFFAEHIAWVAAVLERGRTAGDFRFDGPSEPLARFILAAIEGAMMIKRTSGDAGLVDEVIGQATRMIGACPGAGQPAATVAG